MATELEKLSHLVGGSSEESTDLTDMLALSLKNELSKSGIKSTNAISTEEDRIEDNEEDHMYIPPVPTVPFADKVDAIIEALRNVHSNLMGVFDTCTINTKMGEILTDQINKIGSCLVNMGEEDIEYFDPLNYVSGLEVPDFMRSAKEVLERTKKCYRLGYVDEESSVSSDGRVITIRMDGKQGNDDFVVQGVIESDFWDGSEAIDYIYSRDGGKMSVKCFEKGKWVDANRDSEKYKISFKLIKDESSPNTLNNNMIKENDVDIEYVENEEADIAS